KLNIVLVCEAGNVFASVAAIARAFPVFTRKSDPPPKVDLTIELCLPEGEELAKEDLELIENVAYSIRETCRMIDAPSNEMSTDALLSEVLSVADELGLKSIVITNATKSYCLCGKGVVFDSGGMQIKGKTGMPGKLMINSDLETIVCNVDCIVSKEETSMKRDMGGAAGMLGTFYCLVKSGFSEKLYLCLAIVENSVANFAK
ncbi:unnamed protein product, partial [Cylicostephanus goldi]